MNKIDVEMVVTAERPPSDGAMRSDLYARLFRGWGYDLCVLCELLQTKQEAAERKTVKHGA